MGNSIGGRKKTAKVMKIDGTTFRLKPPARVGDALKEHPGHDLLDSQEVKRLGVRAQPLDPGDSLEPGKLYFIIELPRLPDRRTSRRARSGALQVSSAKDRLESLKLSRRSLSDLSFAKPLQLETATAEKTQDGAMRLRVRLPRAEVAKLMEESKNTADAAEKIVELFVAARDKPPPAATVGANRTAPKEKRTRFMAIGKGVIG